MPTNYPAGLDSYGDIAPDDPTNAPSLSQRLDDVGDAVEAIEAELGLNPSGGAYTTVAAYLADVLLKTLFDAKGDLLLGSGVDAVVKVPVGANNAFIVANASATGGIEWRVLGDADIPAGIARDAEVAASLANYQLLSGKGAASGYAALDASSLVPFSQLPVGTGAAQVAVGSHTHADIKAFTLGCAGIPPAATTNDVADFNLVIPYNVTLQRMKASFKGAPSVSTTLQVRRSTNSGSTFSNAFGTVQVLSSAKVGVADPADLAVNEGDVMQFSVTAGGNSGSNLLLVLIGA